MLRCCDYDAIVHYQPGEFASKYAEDLTGKLERIGPEKMAAWQAESFLDRRYETCITRCPIVMYRLYGRYQSNTNTEHISGARLGGRFVSTEFAESCIDAKIRLALNPGWKNTKMFEAKLLIPAGTRLSIGVVAPVVLNHGTVLTGGAPQILLPKDWSDTWVQGYRRVSGRQLQIEPTFWPIKPEEIVCGKDSLYPDICPRCCYPHIRKLEHTEQFEIVGSKGHRFKMQKQCMNPDCQYFW